MSEQLMDEFDARLVDLMTAYGDRAVTAYDPVAIARSAVAGRPGAAVRLALPREPRVRILLLVAAMIALIALVASLVVGSPRPSPIGDAFASPTAAAWSPDGTKLAFVVDVADGRGDDEPRTSQATSIASFGAIGRPSHPELWLVDGGGGAPRHLATLGSMAGLPQLAWTLDGRSLLVGGTTADGARRSAILLVGLDGSGPSMLADAGTDQIRFSGLSPTGGRLLYVRDQISGADLYALNLASRTSTRLASSAGGIWSPDGTKVLSTDASGAWVVSADGTVRHRLGAGEGMGWSTDGSRAYFQLLQGPMYSASTDGTGVRLEPGLDASYGWVRSPDGSRYVAVTPHGLEIQRPDAAASPLTSEGSDQQPTWSPDGAWVAFFGDRAGIEGVYAVQASGGEPRLVAAQATTVGDLWRPGVGQAALTLIRDHAIITVGAAGTGLRDIVTRQMISGDPLAGPAPADSADTRTHIVIGPEGPDRDIYNVAGGARFEVIIENRSDIAWVPWGLAEKDSYCHLVSGPAYSGNPCTVGPHQIVQFQPTGLPLSGQLEIWIAPEGAQYVTGFPVILDLQNER